MARIYSQKMPVVFEYSGSLAADAELSGSLICNGYARLVGMIVSTASSEGSGLGIRQSADYGQNFNLTTASDAISTGAGSTSHSVEILGNAVLIDYENGSESASVYAFYTLRPI